MLRVRSLFDPLADVGSGRLEADHQLRLALHSRKSAKAATAMAARFLKAVLSGTVAAAIGPVLLIIAAATSPGWASPDAIPLYAQIAIAIAISLVLVTVATLAVGAPARMVLRRLRIEDVGTYVIIGALGGAGFVLGLVALIGQIADVAILLLAAFSGAITGYMWEHSRPRGEGAEDVTSGRFVVSLMRKSMGDVTVPRWPSATVPAGDISIPPVAWVMSICVIALAVIVAAGAEGRLDWLPRQDYFPPSYRTTHVQCLAGRHDEASRPTLIVGHVEEEWYQQHWRAAQEPSLYLASRASGANKTLTYRFTWLRSFHEPVIVRVDEAPDQSLKLRATQMSGRGGYSPGRPERVVERRLTDAEAAKLRRAISANRLFEQPQIGCQEGTDGSRWLIEANDHGSYRYLQRWTPQGGAVRETGLILLGFTGWTFNQVY